MARPPNELIGHDRIREPEEPEELQTALVGVISVTMTKSDPTPPALTPLPPIGQPNTRRQWTKTSKNKSAGVTLLLKVNVSGDAFKLR